MAKNYLNQEEFRWRRKRRKSLSGSPLRGAESYLQERCVSWFRVEYPEYEQLLFSIPNGSFRKNQVGEVMKKEGMVKGVSDLLLLVPSRKYHGMAIEFKVEGRKLSKEQMEWATKVMGQGYQFRVVRGFAAFKRVIFEYGLIQK